VTRSEPGASETAGRLRAIGFEATVEPVFAIAPVDAEVPAFDALAFTSANGVRRFALLSPRRNVPVFCVGDRTADVARAMGFAEAVSAGGDVKALADLVVRRLPAGAMLLHAGNEESRGDLAGRVQAAGRNAEFLPVFRAVPVTAPGPKLAQHFAGQARFDAVLVHSPRAGTILADFAAGSGGGRLPVVAISQAAAAPLLAHASAVEIAATPDEPALISALARLVFG
jgi:uroporphyrinogen-III synthase